ncbi:MAG: sugar phosphate isomerase/epimerase [Spirochaetes bacterium]|nr:sugar phosphate isomerase/epimerase [Spirochaetota bacterium]
MENLNRLAIHTITTKPWPIEEAIERYASAGVKGISVWRDALDGRNVKKIGEKIRSSGLSIVATVRGGFFPALSETERQARIEDNKAFIQLSAELGSPLLVIVPGAHPGQSLEESRRQIRKGMEAILKEAETVGLRLAIEPLHPMYADTRSAIVTLEQANDLCRELEHPLLGIAVDVYHVWWDPNLPRELKRAGERNKIFAFHVCDWKSPTTDFLNDRGLMGEGCIDIPGIRRDVEKNGFLGFIEVEIFSTRYWSMDQQEYLEKITEAYRQHV